MKSYNNPIEFWQKTANEIGGTFKHTKQTQNAGMHGDYFHLRILKEYQRLNIELHSTYFQSPAEREKFGLSFLRIFLEIENREEFFLYIWEKGFLEKLFSKQRKDDPFEFHKKFGYQTNKNNEVENFFSKKENQDLIFGLETSTFNIQYVDKTIKIKYQTNETILDGKILMTEYQIFIKFIDALLNSHLI